MKQYLFTVLLGAFICAATDPVRADLLGVSPGLPSISYVNQDLSAVNYDSGAHIFSVNAEPTGILFSPTESGIIISGARNLQISIQVDNAGVLVTGTNGFSVTGDFTRIVNGVATTYSGTLLTGDIIAFGYLEGGVSDNFEFRIHVTGGQLLSFFNYGSDVGNNLVCELSTFKGNFAESFQGSAKGTCGPEDTTPPTITCPAAEAIQTTPATDPNDPSIKGFIVTYPDPIATDNSGIPPFVFADVSSGTFLPLNAGDNVTITVFAIDSAGNYDFCAFTVVMKQPDSSSCPLAFTDGACAPVTLPSDLGNCSARYVFSLPVATNCSGTFMATATALSEVGAVIPLTILTNGLVQGVFPRTTTMTGNVITFKATDGQSNSVVRQCQLFVQDTQPPILRCLNQTATFRPILTNALSCIAADFDNVCILKSNYLWFSSVIQNTSWRNNPGSFTVHIFDQTIQLEVDNTNLTLNVPDAYVSFSNGVPTATTIFTNNQWRTYANSGFSGKAFAAGLAWQLPFNLNNLVGNRWGRDRDDDSCRRHVNSATWSARFAVDTTGVALQWQWGAVVQSSGTNNYNALCVKPVDDDKHSCWKNLDPAGSCEKFKSCLIRGGRGQGWRWNGHEQQPDCTGILSDLKRCNLGKGMACEGVVEFKPPLAADNCDGSVKVICDPQSGSVFGPGDHLINCTAVDASGNSNQCSFTLTVLPPVQVIFDSPACDNIDDNTAEPDAGFTDMNCPDDPSTPQLINVFRPGDKIRHVVRLLDCNGNDVTTALAASVTVHIDVTERQGTYGNSVLVSDVSQNYSCNGSPGSILVPTCGTFQYNLDTKGYEAGTVNTTRFFRACVWVEYNSSPGIPVGMEDVILESR